MKDCVRKPVIIKLENHSAREMTANLVKKRFESTIDRIRKERTLQNSCKNNLSMISECDDELRNDFNWLINFNLKEISMQDIDEEFHEHTLPSRRNNRLARKNMRVVLTGILEKLLTGDEGLTIRNINKLIKEQYPHMEPFERNWKNTARRILYRNPLFKREKSKQGKSDLWYIKSNYLNDSHCVKHDFKQNYKLEAGKSNSPRPKNIHPLNSLTNQPSIMNFIKHSLMDDSITFTSVTDDTSIGNIEVLNTEIWLEPVDIQSSVEVVADDKPTGYYGLHIPLSTEITGGALEVQFLDENNAFPIELM